MEIANILENKPKGMIYGLMGNINITTNNINYGIATDYKFKGTVKEYLNNSKDISSLKMVMLNETFLMKKANDCSISELKKISLAKILIENKDYIILNYFEKELNYQEKAYFKRLWKRLASDYQKTIVIFTNDITSIWNIDKELIYVDKYQVLNTIPAKHYEQFLSILNKPEIVKFIELMKAKGIDLETYQDPKELLKAIYRIKEGQQ